MSSGLLLNVPPGGVLHKFWIQIWKRRVWFKHPINQTLQDHLEERQTNTPFTQDETN